MPSARRGPLSTGNGTRLPNPGAFEYLTCVDVLGLRPHPHATRTVKRFAHRSSFFTRAPEPLANGSPFFVIKALLPAPALPPPTRARRPRPAPPAPASHTAPSLLTRLLLPTLCSQPCSLSPSVRARDNWEQGVPLRRVRSVAPDNGRWSTTSVPSCLVYQTCGDVHARMEGAF